VVFENSVDATKVLLDDHDVSAGGPGQTFDQSERECFVAFVFQTLDDFIDGLGLALLPQTYHAQTETDLEELFALVAGLHHVGQDECGYVQVAAA